MIRIFTMISFVAVMAAAFAPAVYTYSAII